MTCFCRVSRAGPAGDPDGYHLQVGALWIGLCGGHAATRRHAGEAGLGCLVWWQPRVFSHTRVVASACLCVCGCVKELGAHPPRSPGCQRGSGVPCATLLRSRNECNGMSTCTAKLAPPSSNPADAWFAGGLLRHPSRDRRAAVQPERAAHRIVERRPWNRWLSAGGLIPASAFRRRMGSARNGASL